MSIQSKKLCAIGIAVMSLAACGTSPNNTSSAYPATSSTTSTASGYGVVQSVDTVSREQASHMGLGTIAGAVVGGVLGNQVGSGRGRTAATVAGAAGGALAGNQMQRNMDSSQPVYRISVRMDNGSIQTLAQETQPGVQVGDRVRLANGVIVERMQ
ncbi:glycine zipper 2TM domain-containing protein [Noviherbaspirillum massiliense]|uniref:glycine zipper 2TM domain-containing protein n=1 Tax=Noviherbaspirillum massiliense TaxID=1465823 RepID=UPI0002E8B2D9|nr:glycine zipper 2TM domain-containing protein [Noviherbaspirillum massiliense]